MTLYAVDTSVAVAAVDTMHEAHRGCRAVAAERRPALAGHAAFETFSVLTRLPGAAAVDPATVGRLLQQAFPERCWLSGADQEDLLGRLGALNVSGGTVYDALVGEAARRAGRVLLTRDLRARRTYDRLGVEHELVTGQ